MPTNQVVLSGHIGNTPEPRVTARQGISCTRLALGQNEVYWVDGERQERTHWFYIVCYGRLAENMVEHLEKGAGVVVSGRLSTRPWHDRASEKESMVTEVIAHNIEITRWPRDKSEAGVAIDSPATTEETMEEQLSPIPF